MEEISKVASWLTAKGIKEVDVGIVLGTGLNELLQHVEVKQVIPYGEIPGFPVATVEFHKGMLLYGKVANKHVLIMQGRFHAYEGYSMQQIVLPVRVMKLLGAKQLFLSNAAGGINLNFKKGDLVLIEDHINLLYGNPLTGKNLDQLGPRFPDMSAPYDAALSSLMENQAKQLGVQLKKGVYAAVHGPNLETRAEYRYLKIIGADMVGMSTVPEVIAANHMQLACVAVSVITDECDPDNLKPVDISEIIEVAGKADKKLSQLFFEVIKHIM
jgi:purine-nucleoside phosphorylase